MNPCAASISKYLFWDWAQSKEHFSTQDIIFCRLYQLLPRDRATSWQREAGIGLPSEPHFWQRRWWACRTPQSASDSGHSCPRHWRRWDVPVVAPVADIKKRNNTGTFALMLWEKLLFSTYVNISQELQYTSYRCGKCLSKLVGCGLR